MTYKGVKIDKPTMAMIVEYVKDKGFRFDPVEFYNHYTKRNWTTKSGRMAKTLESLLNAWNSAKKTELARSVASLTTYNDAGYLSDLIHLSRINGISDSTSDWIETTMLSLRSSATESEHNIAKALMKHDVKFIHQAPFVLSGNIYFADFFIPNKHVVIEVDGGYHMGRAQQKKDMFRDVCFNGHMIDVIRVPNRATYNSRDLEIILNKILTN